MQIGGLSQAARCQRKILVFDFYKRPFFFFLPDGHSQYRTFIGAILSIMTTVLVITYAGFKIRDLMNRYDYKIQVRNENTWYDDFDRLENSQGFMFAARMTTYSTDDAEP